MHKLTAGIFAGILTVVAVNAARADIATTTYVQGGVKAATDYTDKQVGDLGALTTSANGNTVAAINEVKGNADKALTDAKAYTDTLANGAVKANTDAIAVLNGSGEGSVAKQISEAVTAMGGDMTEMQDAIEAFKTSTLESITELQNKDTKIEGKIGTVEAGKTVVQMITEVKTAATDGVDTKLADYAKTADMTAELNKKADKTALATTDGNVAKNTSAITTLNAADTVEGSVDYKIKAAVSTINTTTSGLDSRIDTLETDNGTNKSDIATLKSGKQNMSDSTVTATTVNYITKDNKVGANLAALDAQLKTATDSATKANSDLSAFKTAQAATDKTQSDAISALEAKVGENNVTEELEGKMDLAPAAANKLLTTNAAGQVIAATATGTCTPGNGVSCMMISDGNGGFRMERIIDTYSAN
ncbi:MAG: hypothetical protein NC311_03715 [Muribaculaceae bacterium]|nr:hypothetical protein [Muribaculaceae bacterium]